MKVLVTGGAGYIGSAIAHYMVDRGVNVHVIDDLSTGSEILLPEKVKFYKLDIGKEDAINQVIQDLRDEGFTLQVEDNLKDYLSCEIELSENKKSARVDQPHLIDNL